MSGIQTKHGKAFEFASLLALQSALKSSQEVIILDSPQYRIAENYFESLDSGLQSNLLRAGDAATRIIITVEPQLQFPEANIPLLLSIQNDAQGIRGDVRDVLCMRRQNRWQIGLSCKHNHSAIKHSRLSDTIDFGEEWFGVPCSKQYFLEVRSIFGEIRRIISDARLSDETVFWRLMPDKAERFYIPVLRAFKDELIRLTESNPNVPGEMINYLIGRNDFYKVTTDDRNQATKVEAINIHGTLNCPSGNHRSLVNVPILKLPTAIYNIEFLSDNKLEVTFNNGWAISMRIHNASSRLEPSLKFDVQLISLPNSIHSQVVPW